MIKEKGEICMGKWTRAELKGRAKENICKNYWLCVAVSLLMFVSVGIGSIGFRISYEKIYPEYKKNNNSIFDSQYAYQAKQGAQSTRMKRTNTSFEDSSSSETVLLHHYEEDHDYDIDDYYEDDDYDIDDYYEDYGNDIVDDYYHNHQYGGSTGEFIYMLKKVLLLLLIAFLISFVISFAISVLVYMPLQVGSCRFFMCNREDNADLNHLLIGFQNGNYSNVVKIMFVRSIKIALWSLLFVIPGIIKSYEYSMIPYLLSENPGMNKKEAFALSKEMTSGEKWRMFVLGISFFPWMLLVGVTFGLIFIFWIYPYIFATNAELYAVLREKLRFNNGRIVGAENLRYAYADGYQNQSYSNNSYNSNPQEQKAYGNTLDDFDKKNNPPKNLF